MKTLIATLTLCAGAFAQTVSLTANGEAPATIRPGQPLILTATVTALEGPAIEPPPLSVTGRSGASVPVPFILRSQSEPQAFGRMRMYDIVWTLAPEAVRELAPGGYRIEVPNGKGIAITVSTEEDAASRGITLLLLSAHAELEGNRDRALELAEQLIGEEPRSIAGRLRKCDLLLARGDRAGALQMALEAEKLTAGQVAPDPHRPGLIQARIARMLDAPEAR